MDGRHSLPFKKKVVENRCSSDNKQQGKEVNKLSLLSEGHTKQAASDFEGFKWSNINWKEGRSKYSMVDILEKSAN